MLCCCWIQGRKFGLRDALIVIWRCNWIQCSAYYIWIGGWNITNHLLPYRIIRSWITAGRIAYLGLCGNAMLIRFNQDIKDIWDILDTGFMYDNEFGAFIKLICNINVTLDLECCCTSNDLMVNNRRKILYLSLWDIIKQLQLHVLTYMICSHWCHFDIYYLLSLVYYLD